MSKQPSFRDIEQLSAYLDGQLSKAEIARLESHLHSNPELTDALDAMRQSRAILRHLPHRRAPRSFLLTPRMAGLRAPTPRLVPALRMATVLTTVLLTITFAANTFTSLAPASRSAMPYGIGGGAPEEPVEADVQPTEEMLTAAMPPAAEPTPQAIGTDFLTPSQESSIPPSDLPMETPSNKVADSTSEEAVQDLTRQWLVEPQSTSQLIPSSWQIGLFIATVVFGLTAFSIHANNQRAFRRKIKR